MMMRLALQLATDRTLGKALRRGRTARYSASCEEKVRFIAMRADRKELLVFRWPPVVPSRS